MQWPPHDFQRLRRKQRPGHRKRRPAPQRVHQFQDRRTGEERLPRGPYLPRPSDPEAGIRRLLPPVWMPARIRRFRFPGQREGARSNRVRQPAMPGTQVDAPGLLPGVAASAEPPGQVAEADEALLGQGRSERAEHHVLE